MTLKGDIEEIRFRNEENGYTIAVIDAEGEPVIATGVFPPVVEGQTVVLSGDYVVHKKYGRQFKADRCEIEKPTGVDGIVRYLGSGLIKGIGPALALRIVSVFGEKTFSVIENNPSLLSSVRGISKEKAKDIAKAYGEIKEMQDAVMTLQTYDIPLGTALRIYKVYGKNTAQVVTDNPYRLIEDVDGIGFLTADKIAVKTGIEHDSEFRVGAGLIHVLKESVQKGGNTCYPRDAAAEEASLLLGVDVSLVYSAIESLVLERRVRLLEVNGEEVLALPGVYRTEKNAAVLVTRLLEGADSTVYDVTADISEYEKINGIILHERQKEAVTAAISNGATLITGGPGTGKTTIIKCIIEIFDKLNKTVLLMAPTGRAAKRMSEATGREASTIHRACRFGSDMASGENLACDVVIVDEFSMVDVFLFEALLKKITAGTRLVLVGDKDQLPSVGAGNVLADIMRSGVVRSVQLDQIYRQAEESLIVTNAHAVNRGEMPVLDDKTRDFFYVSASDPELIANKTADMVERAAKFIGSTPDRVQVLCPLKNGAAGAIKINRLLQKRLNPYSGGGAVEDEDYVYHEGDKVMHVVNNYDLSWTIASGYSYREGTGVYNGDIGVIREINSSRGEMTVEFEDGRVAVYTPDIYNQLVLAYAITVHKSQGSEFDAVILPVTAGGPMIMTRNLLYTAITRAKKMVVMIGERSRIKFMVDNNYVAARYSLLSDFIIESQKDSALLFGKGDYDERT